MGGIPTIRHNEIHDITATISLKSVAMFQLNHPSNPSPANHLSITQPKETQMLALISVPEGFGTQAKTHFSMLGFSPQRVEQLIHDHLRKHKVTKKREYAQRV